MTAPRQPGRTLRRDMLVAAAALTALLVVTEVVPDTQLAVRSPSARVALETLRVCVVALAALILGLPTEPRRSVARNAFVAALVIIATASAVLGVLPPIVSEITGTSLGASDRFYPWLGSRYIAGLLFVAAGLQWPRLDLRSYLLASLGALVVVEVALSAASTPSRALLVDVADGATATVAWLISLEVPPLLLFGFGAWLVGRHAARSGAPLERWLSISLLVGAFTQLQAIRQPEILGPVVTTTDLLRMVSTTLLLIGAAMQVRQLSRDRLRVVRLQRRELEERDALMDALGGYVAREETFRAVVHHELATPVATIRAYTHVLRAASPSDDRWATALSGIVAEAEQLHALIGRVDELRELEDDAFACTLRPVRAVALLHEVARFATALPGRHDVHVKADDLRINADPVRLGQALRNVVANAVRYSPDGGRIELGGEAVGADRYRLTVTDQGIGFDADETGALLAFAGRGRNTRGVEGAGIGLYVARRIADAHHGRIDIAPNLPTGTRVMIEVERR